MRIITADSNYDVLENINNEMMSRKDTGFTFIPETKEDYATINKIIKELMGIKKGND